MTTRNPLVLINGQVQELPTGDDTPIDLTLQRAILGQLYTLNANLAAKDQIFYLAPTIGAFWAQGQ